MKCVGRADLLVLLDYFGKEGLEQAAQFVGFYQRPKEPVEKKPKKEVYIDDLPAPTNETKVEPRVEEVEPMVHFWRAVAYREKGEEETQADVPAWFKEAISFSRGEVRADYTRTIPSKIPLLPWSRMWPFLFEVLGCYCDMRSIDIKKAVERAARAEPMNRLPFQQRLAWAGTCQIILDMDDYLLPFWDDETDLRKKIEKLRGSSGLEVLVFENGPEGLCRRWRKELEELKPYRIPAPGSPILVISDLGCLEKNDQKLLRGVQGGGFLEKSPPGRRRRSWLRFGKRLNRAGFILTALNLCPSQCWDMELARYWRMVCWDRGEKLPKKIGKHWTGGKPHTGISREMEPGVERLLGLLSAAIRIEPALLRAVRLLLPHWQADVGTEAAVWGHDRVHASPIAFAFDKNSIAYYRELFKKNPDVLKEAVIAVIKHYHAHLSPAVQAEEDLVGADLLGRDTHTTGGHQFMKRVVKTHHDTQFFDQYLLGQWLDRLSSRVHPGVWQKDSVLTAAWLSRNREEWKKGRLSLPAGIDIQKAAWVLGRKLEPVQWVLRRKGGSFIVDRGQWIDEETADGWKDRGSPVAKLTMGSPWLKINTGDSGVEPGYLVNPQAQQENQIPVPFGDRVVLDTDHEQIVIESFSRLDWAIEIRRDEYGLSAVFSGNEGERRLYWLNPGKYPVSALDKKSRKQSPQSFFHINKGCWLEESEFYDILAHGFQQPDWADNFGVDQYGIYTDFSIKKVVQRMRLIIPGEFLMGSPENEPERYDDEQLHQVMLSCSFWLAETACTQELWKAVMGRNPSDFKGAQRPVENVSWNDCRNFIKKINRLKPGLDLSLPTEAQWEYACRAGTQTPFWFGDNITPEQVNYDGNRPYAGGEKGKYRSETVEVKSLPCNGWGLYQMHGNVWEWCADWFGDYPSESVIDPVGPLDGTYRVIRGGSWFYDGGLVRSACRHRDEPASRDHDAGFRLARGQKETGQ